MLSLSTQSHSPWLLLSGGLDSATLLAWWCHHYPASQLNAVWCNYGQRAFEREQLAVVALASHYGVTLHNIPLTWLAELLPVGLAPSHKAGSISNQQAGGLPTQAVWVPNRNGVFINLAASLAEAHGGDAVWFGANLDEAQAGFPDNSEAFRQRITQSLAYSTLTQVKVEAPLEQLTKADTVALAHQLGLPFAHVWSCYEADELPCGLCASCQLLRGALAANQLTPQDVGLVFKGG